MSDMSDRATAQDLLVLRYTARAWMSARRAQKKPVPRQVQDFADGKVDRPGPPLEGRPIPVGVDRAEWQELAERRSVARAWISARRAQKKPVPRQVQDFADGNVDDPGPL